MKKNVLTALMAVLSILAIFFVSCSDNQFEHEEFVDRQMKSASAEQKNIVVGTVLFDSVAVTSPTEAMAYIMEAEVTENGDTLRESMHVIESQLLRRGTDTIYLGTQVTKMYGVMSRVGEPEISTPTAIDTYPGGGHFIIDMMQFTVNSTITNGDIVFNPFYRNHFETCKWVTEDTVIVFNIHWDVIDEVPHVDANGNVSDELSLIFCNDMRQTANEFGTMTLAKKSHLQKVDFATTFRGREWFAGCAIHLDCGTIAIALNSDGSIAFKEDGITPDRCQYWAGDTLSAYNTAFFYNNEWHPAIASDQNDCLDWSNGNGVIDTMSRAATKTFTNWGNGKKIGGRATVFLDDFGFVDNPETNTVSFTYKGQISGTLNYGKIAGL